MSINSVENIKPKKNLFDKLVGFFFRTASFFEVLIILGFWLWIVGYKGMLEGYTRKEIITYLIIGNILVTSSEIILRNFVLFDFNKIDRNIINKPFKLLAHTIFINLKNTTKFFFESLIFNVIVVYIFSKNILVNFEARYLILIAFIIMLSFIMEIFLLNIFRLSSVWIFENKSLAIIGNRLKKIISGAYFPLNFLPVQLLSLSYLFPFAYSFYVPTELYLKKIPIDVAWYGVIVELLWIFILFILFRQLLKNKLEKNA